MKVECFPYGPLGSNLYILHTESGCYVIDPSVDPDKISITSRPYKINAILVTHGHFDHINAIDKWNWIYPDAPVYMSSEDMIMLKDSSKNGSGFFAEMCSYNCRVNDIKNLDLSILKVFETPGHSKGSLCFLFDEGKEKVLFTGDTVFPGSVGRTDLYGGNNRELMSSLKLLKDIPADTVIYPGHGSVTTMKQELKYNPFFNF